MLGKCSTGVSSPSLHNYLCKVNPREKRVETDFFFLNLVLQNPKLIKPIAHACCILTSPANSPFPLPPTMGLAHTENRGVSGVQLSSVFLSEAHPGVSS